jgi:hypothetical protein
VALTQKLEQHLCWVVGRQGLPIGRHIVVVVVVGVVVEVVGVVVLVKQSAHLPLQSQGWFSRCNRRRLRLTQRVSALAKSHSSVARSKGTWQTRRQSSSASAREGISAARAVPAKSFSARRRLRAHSATARARSSKERLAVSWLTGAPFPKGRD